MLRYDELVTRSGGQCEFCNATEQLASVTLTDDDQILLCLICRGELDAPKGHWHCLQGAAWSEVPSVQVAVWQKLAEIDEAWAADTREMMVVDPEALSRLASVNQPQDIHRDSNGMQLAHGDTVVLVKDLPVKGAGFTAKRGTAVRNIGLVPDNAAHIEGRVDGQRIVILTEFVKRK